MTKKSEFLSSLDSLAKDVYKNHIKYKNKGVGSWKAVVKQKGINCCTYVSIAMQRVGILKGHAVFYCKNGKLKGKHAGHVKRYCKVKQGVNTPLATAVKKGIVKKYDIIGAQKGAHTMVYLGKDSKGYHFASLSKKTIKNKTIMQNHRKGPYKVGVVIRPKWAKKKEVKKMATKKTAKKVNKKVAVFVGHGIQTNGVGDCGCAWKGHTEVELCTPIVAAAVKYLKQAGVTVVTDYPSNKINMVKQVALANEEKAKVEVAVHCDYSKAPKGTIPLYTSTEGKKLATAMNKHVVKETKCKTRGTCHRTDLYELNATNMPACIFEVGAITEFSTITKNADAYGKGIAEGICEYLGVTFKG